MFKLNEIGQCTRFRYISHQQAAKAQACLCALSSESLASQIQCICRCIYRVSQTEIKSDMSACVRGDTTLTCFVVVVVFFVVCFLQLMRGSKCYDKRAIIGPTARRH